MKQSNMDLIRSQNDCNSLIRICLFMCIPCVCPNEFFISSNVTRVLLSVGRKIHEMRLNDD